VNLTAKLEIIYRHSAQLCWTIHVSIQMSSPLLHHAYYCIQTVHCTRRAEDGKYQVSCSCSVLFVPVVCCVPATDCKQKHRLSFLLHTGLQIPARQQCQEPVDASQRCMHSLKQIKAEPAPPSTGRSTDWRRPSVHTGVALPAQRFTQKAWTTGLPRSRSAVDDITITDHFVKWSRQVLII